MQYKFIVLEFIVENIKKVINPCHTRIFRFSLETPLHFLYIFFCNFLIRLNCAMQKNQLLLISAKKIHIVTSDERYEKNKKEKIFSATCAHIYADVMFFIYMLMSRNILNFIFLWIFLAVACQRTHLL